MSVQSDLITTIKTQLQALSTALTGSGGMADIPSQSVVVRPMKWEPTIWEQWRNEFAPAWVIGIGDVKSDPNEGNNDDNDVIYTFWLCGIDKEDDYLNFDRDILWSNRLQAVRRYFHMTNLAAATVGGIVVTLCWCPETNEYDEQIRKIHHIIKKVIPIFVKIREPRDSNGVG